MGEYSKVESTGDITSIFDLIDVLGGSSTKASWYRGHSEVDWSLLPKLAREPDGLKREGDITSRFRQSASLLLQPRPRTDWEWLTVMQHYGVPTRLLDWTESPLVALYFVIAECRACDGALWVLDPTQLNQHSGISPDYDRYIPSFGDETTNNYLPSSLRAEAMTRLDPIAVIGPRNTPRMQAQLGVFTVMHRDPIPVECVANGKHIRKFRVPQSAKDNLRDELALLAIGKFQLFPEVESLGDMLGDVADA